MEGNKSTLGLRGPDANAWKGGRRKDQDGRVWIFCPNHPRAVGGKYVFEHALVIEKAMGKLLPPRSVAHHVNGDESNNSNSNLVLCDSQSYHTLIHVRTRAYLACGNANWLRCRYCGNHDDPKNMTVLIKNDKFINIYHRPCKAKNEAERKLKLRGLA